jgi:uncharacterized membrane protein
MPYRDIFDIWKNLLLAFAPLAIAYLTLRKQPLWAKWLVGLVWLLFLPNSTYMLTEFEHISQTEGLIDVLWLMTVITLSLAFMCWSADRVRQMIRLEYGIVWESLAMAGVFLLNGYGVYLGLIPRLNSWDVFIHPLEILKAVLATSNLQAIEITAFFAIVSIVVYEGYRVVVVAHQPSHPHLSLEQNA